MPARKKKTNKSAGSVRVLRVPTHEADLRSQIQAYQRALKRQFVAPGITQIGVGANQFHRRECLPDAFDRIIPRRIIDHDYPVMVVVEVCQRLQTINRLVGIIPVQHRDADFRIHCCSRI